MRNELKSDIMSGLTVRIDRRCRWRPAVVWDAGRGPRAPLLSDPAWSAAVYLGLSPSPRRSRCLEFLPGSCQPSNTRCGWTDLERKRDSDRQESRGSKQPRLTFLVTSKHYVWDLGPLVCKNNQKLLKNKITWLYLILSWWGF